MVSLGLAGQAQQYVTYIRVRVVDLERAEKGYVLVVQAADKLRIMRISDAMDGQHGGQEERGVRRGKREGGDR